MGLATVVAYHSAFQVAFLQERHIHECHATEIETEQEQVSCLVKGGTCWQVQVFYLANVIDGDGSLACSRVGGLYVRKDVVGRCLTCFHCLVVKGAQGAQIERDGVWTDASVPEP